LAKRYLNFVTCIGMKFLIKKTFQKGKKTLWKKQNAIWTFDCNLEGSILPTFHKAAFVQVEEKMRFFQNNFDTRIFVCNRRYYYFPLSLRTFKAGQGAFIYRHFFENVKKHFIPSQFFAGSAKMQQHRCECKKRRIACHPSAIITYGNNSMKQRIK